MLKFSLMPAKHDLQGVYANHPIEGCRVGIWFRAITSSPTRMEAYGAFACELDPFDCVRQHDFFSLKTSVLVSVYGRVM